VERSLDHAVDLEYAPSGLTLASHPPNCFWTGALYASGPNFCMNPVQASPLMHMEEDAVMTKFALYVPLQAKPGKEKEVADFLRSAVPLVNDEPGTVSWFAIQQGPSSFAIFDTFDDEAGRDAHLNGKVASALMEKIKAGDLFAKTPEIHKLEILADKLPK
jgi:quinol monooxygenase YgiN